MRHKPIQHVYKPVRSSNPICSCICDFQTPTISVVTVWIIIAISDEMTQRNGCSVLAWTNWGHLWFPDAGFLTTHTALASPDLCEFGQLLGLNLDSSKHTFWNLDVSFLIALSWDWSHKWSTSIKCPDNSIFVVFPATNSLLEFIEIDVSIFVLIQLLHEINKQRIVQFQSQPVETVTKILNSQHTVSVMVKRSKGVTSIHAPGFEQCRDATNSDTVL
mmetsp:Transcript_2372/g.3476  ORF Transcript_2372/g.3476 Transcript_2372/m.3476 type:complete len:218 (+) Transcript_2372:533-1186(+)